MHIVEDQIKLKVYALNKSSGINWIGEIPNNWMVVSNRVLFKERNEPGNESLPILSVSIHTAVSNDELSEEDNIQGRNRIADKTSYKLVEPGDIVFNMMRAWQGAIGSVAINGMVSPAYIVAKPSNMIDSSFFEYQYRTPTFIQQMDQNSKGITDFRKRLYWQEFKNLKTILPPIEEQITIVSFLDRKTTQIDNAISIKEKQIELLHERRQILINNAVTRGLDPDVKFKDSGVEWIGEIPEHWEIRHLRRLFTFLNYKRIPLAADVREKMSGQYPYYGASGIIDYVDNYIFDEPLILIAEDGANLLSKSSPLAFIASGKYWVNNHAHIIKPIFNGFTYWAELLSTIDYTVQISGAAQPKLTKDNLASIQLPVPPENEILEIVQFIDNVGMKISRAISCKEEEIARLLEYKSTLINSAVTGKIKVS